MENLTIEQQRALALARARLRLQASAPTGQRPENKPLSHAADEALERERVRDIPQERQMRVGRDAPALMNPLESGAGFRYQVTPAEEEGMRAAASYIPVVSASMAATPTSVGYGGAMLIPAAAEVAGSLFRGDSSADTVRNAFIAGLTPGFKVSEAEKFLPRALLNAVTDFGMFSTAIVVGETAGGVVSGKRFRDSLTDSFNMGNFVIPAAMAPFSGTLRAFSDRSAFLNKEAEKVRAELQELVGDRIAKEKDFVHFGPQPQGGGSAYAETAALELTPGLVHPERYAKIEHSIIANDQQGKYAKAERQLSGEVSRSWVNSFPEANTGPNIAQALEPYMVQANLYNQATADLAKLQVVAAERKEALYFIRGTPDAKSPEKIAKARAEAVSAEMAVINQEARALFFKANADALSPKGLAPSTVQKAFTDTKEKLFTARSQQAAALYEASGVPFDVPFISVDALVDSVRSATKAESGLYVESIVKTIRKEGGESGLLTVNQMKQMRANFGSEFTSTDPTALDQFDRISNIAYNAVTGRTSSIVGQQFGKEAQNSIAEVNAWWGRTANLANSKSLKRIFPSEPSENMAEGLAKKLVDGELKTFEQFAEFVNDIGTYAPDVADLGRRTMVETLREGMFYLSTTPGGRIDPAKLYSSLASASRYKELRNILPIERLGFGTSQQVQEIASTFRAAGIKTVTPAEMDEFYNNPLVSSALANRGKIKAAARPAAARIVFDRRVNELLARQAAGAPVTTKDWDRAVALRRHADLNVDEAKKRVENLKSNNPIFQFFSNPGTAVGQTLEPNAIRQTTNYLQNMPVTARKQFIDALRQANPQILRDVQGRVMVDMLANVVKGSADSKLPVTVDLRAVQKTFNEGIKDLESPIYLLKDVMEPADFQRFKVKMPALARIIAWSQGGNNSTLPFDIRNIAGGGASRAANVGLNPSTMRSIFGTMWSSYQGFRFNTAAAMIQDAEVARFILSAGQYNLPIQKLILLRANQPLMDEGLIPEPKQPWEPRR